MFAKSILFVEDERLPRLWFQRHFSRAGYRVSAVSSKALALAELRAELPAIMVADLRIGTDWGLDLVREAKSITPSIRVIVVSGWITVETTAEAMRAGCELVLAKPLLPAELLERLERIGDEPSADYHERPPTLARAMFEHAMRVFADAHGNLRGRECPSRPVTASPCAA